MNDGLGEGTPPTPGKKEARGRKRRSDEPVSKVRVVIGFNSSVSYHHHYCCYQVSEYQRRQEELQRQMEESTRQEETLRSESTVSLD